ncbi:MAG: RNA polymerase sigma factor [Pirellulaceae bacterium]|nr:RNA polymerase sigma factor [Planctomycetales bacterium]
MSDDVREIVGRAKRGDTAAMRRLVELYGPRVFGLCCRMLGQREDAEDAAQETLVRMFKSLERWDDTRPFEPWLLAIAGNRCRTRLARRASTPRCVTLEESDVAQSYDSEQGARQIDEEVRLALCEVTPRYRQAFLGFHEHGLSYAQIAEWLEVPLGTVKTWVRRARIQLMDRLKARGAIEESQHELRQV